MFTDVLSVAKFIMNVGIGTYVGITLCRWGGDVQGQGKGSS